MQTSVLCGQVETVATTTQFESDRHYISISSENIFNEFGSRICVSTHLFTKLYSYFSLIFTALTIVYTVARWY